MSTKFASVWDAIEDTPEAAKKFGVTQPRISDLVRGRIDLLANDTLVNILAAAEMHIELHMAA